MHTTLTEDDFSLANLGSIILIVALYDKKKDHLISLTKSANLITKLINKNLYSLLSNKTAFKI